MTATWTTPKTWNTGDPLTASDMNTHIRDNMEYIKSPPTAYYKTNENSDYTTTSTSFANVDNTHLALSITTTGGVVRVTFSGSIKNTALGNITYLDVEIDGLTRYGGDDGLILVTQYVAGHAINVSFSVLIPGLSPASHTFRLQWKVSAGTSTMWAGAGTASVDVHPQFSVEEVP